jgi:peptidoglycan/LPS O-acetylase OafA/YrhL
VSRTPATTSRLPDLPFLDALRGLLIVFVIAIHAGSYAQLQPGWASELTYFVVATATVKGFFLVDGFLFARSLEKATQASSLVRLQTSATRLLLPWLLFSGAYLLLRMYGGRLGMLPPASMPDGHWSIAGATAALWYSETSAQMYFLVSLFAVRAVAITCVAWLRRCPAGVLALLAVALALLFRQVVEPWALGANARSVMDPMLLALGGSAFFVAGMAMWRARWHEFPQRLALSGLLLLVSVAATRIGAHWGHAVSEFAYVAALFLAFAAFAGVPAWVAAIGRRTMGIYLLHLPIIMHLVTSLTYRLAVGSGFPAYFLIVPLTALASLLAVLVAERLGVAPLLFGETRPAGRAQA